MNLWYYDGPNSYGQTWVHREWKEDMFAPYSETSLFFLTEEALNLYINWLENIKDKLI